MVAKKSTKAKEPQKSGGLGLESIGDLSGLLDAPQVTQTSGPILLLLGVIDEDPNQPRKENNPGFSKESLEDLAATIRPRGVKSPISVRENPDVPGRFIINHGARRYRASIIADKKHIPAFIDNDYNETDQVIENLQRDELTPREIADYVGRELARGKKKGEIAKDIGKSNAYISQHVTLLDLPESIANAFNSGRASDVTVVNELVTAYKKAPEAVDAFLEDENQELTRGSVKLLREYLDDKTGKDPITVDSFSGQSDAGTTQDEELDQEGKKPKQSKEEDPDKLKKAIVQVSHDDRPARLILNRRPPADGFAWLKYDDDGQEFEANLATVKLVAIMEG